MHAHMELPMHASKRDSSSVVDHRINFHCEDSGPFLITTTCIVIGLNPSTNLSNRVLDWSYSFPSLLSFSGIQVRTTSAKKESKAHCKHASCEGMCAYTYALILTNEPGCIFRQQHVKQCFETSANFSKHFTHECTHAHTRLSTY